MGKNSDELRQDIRSCFKLINQLEEKCDNRFTSGESKVSELNTDLKILIKEVGNLANSVSVHVVDFKKHNDEEMDNYKKINEMFSSTKESMDKLGSSVDGIKTTLNEIVLDNVDRDKKLKDFEDRQNLILKVIGGLTFASAIVYGLFESGIIVFGK